MRARVRRVFGVGLLALALGSGCSFLAEQVTDESFAREPEMESLRARVAEAIGLQAPPGRDAPTRGAGGGHPDIDGSQRWVSAKGRLEGELPEAGEGVADDLAAAGLVVLEDPREDPDSPAAESRVRATSDDLVVRVTLFDAGNPAALPAEQDTVYAEIRVALRDSVGLSWTHVDGRQLTS